MRGPAAGWRALAHEILKFLMVGGLAFVVDVGLSNWLVFGFFDGTGPLEDHPMTAKVLAVSVSILVAWVGNRLWTYGNRETGSTMRGLVLFVVVNLVGMGLTLVPLLVTWYLMGLRDPVSYNIATNVIGMGLAMVFRFYAYRTWVFRHQPPHEPVERVA